jgi:hypothetical protein
MTGKGTDVPFNISATLSNRIKTPSSVTKGSITVFDRGEALGDTELQGITNENGCGSGEPRPATGFSSIK